MTDIAQLIQSGSAHVWLYVPVAVLLGALHGLEPGHSKTMMAAFIIAIRGTIWQAVLLGLSAAISHSLIIWLLAALALNYGEKWNAEDSEPYLHLVSAVMILGLAVWMFFRTRREVAEAAAHAHGHSHDDELGHAHGLVSEAAAPVELAVPEGLSAPSRLLKRRTRPSTMLDTGHGWLQVTIVDAAGGPRFRVTPSKASGQALPLPKGTTMGLETARLDGSTQRFSFEAKDGCWEATAVLPEPHTFAAVVSMSHGDHAHTYRLRFNDEPQDGGSAPAVVEEKEVGGVEYQDAHERAHAEDIARRFANRSVTTSQIVMFGITGGLMPCPAAFSILLVCLQVKRAAMGFAFVGAFSFGLALTMVTVGVIAAWSVQHAQKRYAGFGDWMRRAPYISCALLVLLAGFMAWQGWVGLHGHSHDS